MADSKTIKAAAKNFAVQLVTTALILGVVSFLFLGIARHIGFMFPGGTVIASAGTIVVLIIFTLSVLFPITEDLFTQTLCIDKNEISYTRGMLTTKEVTMPRHFVFSVEVTQTPYQSLVGTADISILSGGYSSIQFRGALLEDAAKIKHEIHCISETGAGK